MSDTYLNDPHFTRVFLSQVKSADGEKFREVISGQSQKIIELLQETSSVCRGLY